MATWPGTLPDAPQYGWSETPGNSLVRTETDAGPAKTRRRFSSAPSQFSLQFSLTTAQATTLMDFYTNGTADGGTAGGAMTFDTLSHPRTGLGVGTATTTNGWRFLAPPVITQDTFEHFRASLRLELLG